MVTTGDEAGGWNLAPMGPHVSPEWLIDGDGEPDMRLLPFEGSRTHANLRRHPFAVVHFVDDPMMFARGVLGGWSDRELDCMTVPVAGHAVRRLKACQRFLVVRLHSGDWNQTRPKLTADVLLDQSVDPPAGFNRGHAAVIEAAILASRVRHLSRSELMAHWDFLRSAVEKTGSPAALEAFTMLDRYVREHANG